jgi:hypothetical protein
MISIAEQLRPHLQRLWSLHLEHFVMPSEERRATIALPKERSEERGKTQVRSARAVRKAMIEAIN